MNESNELEGVSPEEACFIKLQTIRALYRQENQEERQEEKQEENRNKVSLRDLGLWFYQPGGEKDAWVEEALRTDLGLYACYRRLRDDSSRVIIPKSAMAGSHKVEQRHGDGFRVFMKPSRANPDQIYVILECDESTGIADEQEIILLIEPEDAARENGFPMRMTFPPVSGGRTSLLLSRSNPVLDRLSDDDCEIRMVEITA